MTQMKKLQEHEHRLDGEWLVEGKVVVEDVTSKRIRWLIDSVLKKVVVDGWSSLFRDPADGRYWELTHNHGGWHGGGPPSLIEISRSAAADKYNIAIDEFKQLEGDVMS